MQHTASSSTPLRRRTVLGTGALSLLLAGCGFKLRGAQEFSFTSIYFNGGESSLVLGELRRTMQSNAQLQVITDAKQLNSAQVVLDVLQDQREKTVVGVTSSGQVREFQLRLRFKFKLRNQAGRELIAESEILQQRDISFNETAVLSKEAEEAQLYRNMQSDIVQQVQRRLAAVRSV